MDHAKKLEFIHRMTKLGLQHFDAGGPVNSGTTNSDANFQKTYAHMPTTNYVQNQNLSNHQGEVTEGTLSGLGNMATGAAADFTAQNQYQAGLAPTTQYDYGDFIGGSGQAALGANGETQNILAQQQALSNQLQAQSQGYGPNPAQAQLNQTTGNNIAAQNALMAGQRGAGTNAGLIARQAAMQGANTQQQAVGQAAVLRANQQLDAQRQLAQQQQNMGNLNVNSQNANTSLFGAGAAANNAQNNTNVANYGMAQGINANTAQQNANATNATLGSALSGVSSIGSMFMADGGEVTAASVTPEPAAPSFNEPMAAAPPKSDDDKKSGGGGGGAGALGLLALLADGGQVAQPQSYIANYLNPSKKQSGGSGLDTRGMAAGGGKVNAKNPGQKAEKKDNSFSNDKIPALLSEGEIVLPRTVTTHANAPAKAAEFVRATLAKKQRGLRR